jgi:hypothetical protein
LEAGVVAGAAALVFCAFACWVQGDSPFTVINLLASTFYGARMLRQDFVWWRSFSGLSLHFCLAGCAGAVFSFLRRPAWGFATTAVIGTVYSAFLYIAANAWLWRKWNPGWAAYSGQGFILAGYVLFGLLLGMIPAMERSIDRHM